MSERQFRLGAVILGAGRSTRMGRPKLLLPWAGTSIVGFLIREWEELGAAQVAVVCAADDAAMATELERVGFPDVNRIYNPAPERGMFSSIQCAAEWPGWRSGLTHWAVLLGDQPHLRRETLRALLGFAADHPDTVCQPGCAGRRAHPVILPKGLFAELRTTAAPDLKAFLAGREVSVCQVEDPALHRDLDYPEDYRWAVDLRGPDVSTS